MTLCALVMAATTLTGASRNAQTNASQASAQEDYVQSQKTTVQTSNQETSQEWQEKENVGVYIPLDYDYLTGNPKRYDLNAKCIYRIKVMEGDTISKYVRMEEWPESSPPSDSLIGVIYTALNGKKADINTLIDYVILEDVDGDGKILGREGERILAPEVVKLVIQNVYNGDKK